VLVEVLEQRPHQVGVADMDSQLPRLPPQKRCPSFAERAWRRTP
jgi:hypothetical protein